jgi:NADH-quinone oxidoreductase subunit L
VPRKLASSWKGIYRLLFNKYKLDEFYFASVVDPCLQTSRSFLWKVFDVKFIDGIVNGLATLSKELGGYARKIQTGIVQNYALIMTAGIILIFFWLFMSI